MSKGTETRNRIIVKAARLFNKKGFDGCSMQNIVDAVGLEKGSLYGHFPNKEALALASFEYSWKKTCAARTAKMDTVANAVDKLKIHIDNALSCSSFSGGCPLLNSIVDNDDGNPALKKLTREAIKGWRHFLQGIVLEGQHRKEIRVEIEPEEIASLIISLLEGALAIDRLDRKSGFPEIAGRHLMTYLNTVKWQSSRPL
ncbi:MAG: TetR/AcrR family transcriptional regulator [Edaphobacter sp.]